MKKSLLTLGAACLAMSSLASTRVLYNQNFEKAADPAAAGWTDYRGKMFIASDEFGKFLEIDQNGQNGGSTYVHWGQDIFVGADGASIVEDTYNVHFEYCIKNSNCNQYNSAITIFTNKLPGANQPYRNMWSPAGYWQNYVFDASQVDNGTKDALLYVINAGTVTTENTADDGTVSYSYSINYDQDQQTLAENVWYVVDLTVNVKTREVEYMVTSVAGQTIQGGTISVPETNIADGSEISMYAEGMNVMLARTATIYDIDNIIVSVDIEGDWANDPAVALTRIGKTADEELNLNLRAYTITFAEGETLHIVGTDGADDTVAYEDCDGEYVYETTTSGTLKAWTTSGEATSQVIETAVECVPVVLPEAVATISSVAEGYGKTYTLTVSNSEVELQPTIFINYEFTGVSGNKISAEGEASGVKVVVAEEGTLKITTEAFGYESTTATVVNDLSFETKNVWDFARMSKEEIAAAGFPKDFTVLNSGSTSGFNNWTARKRLYYTSTTETEEKVDEEGNVSVVPATIYPFGFIAEDNTTNVIEYSVIDRSAVAETAKGELFEGLTIFPERGKVAEGGLPNVGMLYRIGLYNDQTTNNNNNVYINDLDQNDFVVVNYINNYGGNSIHPEVASDDEYYALLAGEDAVYSVAQSGVLNEETGLYDLVYALYRIDTAITKITVFQEAGSVPDAVEAIESAVAGDNNWYSIDGVRVAQPTKAGIYIHNGKKIIVK